LLCGIPQLLLPVLHDKNIDEGDMISKEKGISSEKMGDECDLSRGKTGTSPREIGS
jgi:hypothetical protein